MKRRFLPISLLLTVIVLAQTSFMANAHGESGRYVPRSTMQATVQSFMKSIRANQETGLIDPAWFMESSSQAQRELNPDWISLGPDNYGSFTRAIVFDKKDATNKTIYIGTMGGGVFKSVNGGITWKSVSGNMMVSSMTQTEDGTIYVGTGDGRNVQKQNGLSDLSYSTSFNGEGIYKSEGDNFVNISSTSEWYFVNELTAFGNTVYAATTDGLFVTTDGENWTSIMEGNALSVKTNSTGIVLAYVDNDVYTYNPETAETKVITNDELLPAGNSYKIIATSPSNPDYVYVAYLDKDEADTTVYKTGNIYVTDNFTKEEMSWVIAYHATPMYDLFGNNGTIDNALAVHPNDPKKLFIGGNDLWIAQDGGNTGVYRIEKISSGSGFQISGSGGGYVYNYTYIHTGIQNIVFNPNNANEFFVGSEGGIFKGQYSDNSYTFEGKNRYFLDENNHTSVARMFSVAFSGANTVIGGSLEHGTIKVIGNPALNNVCTGSSIFPNDQTSTDASATYGSFDKTMAGGPCAMSTINPNAMFITTTGDYKRTDDGPYTSIFRTQTAGNDYDKENFSYSATNSNTPYIYSMNAFRTPIAFFENYNDDKAVDSVKFYADMNYKAGDTITVHSLNGDYPFMHILTEDLAFQDSILVQDIISSTFLVAAMESASDKEVDVFMTRDALKFNKTAEWWKIGTYSSNPNAIAISGDGDVAFVGTVDGKLYKYENLTNATTELAAEGFAGTDTVKEYIYEYVPDYSKEWDTTYIYNKVIIDSIVNNDTLHMEVVFDTTYILDTVWKKTDVILDVIVTPGEAPIASIISSGEADTTTFKGQAITSISIDPNDSNFVLVTLGNYGNDNYVFYSTNGGESFSSIQGNLPKLPVYSGLIEKHGNVIIVGTEKGIYSTIDGVDWSFDGLANIPVMDLKQQIVANHKDLYKYIVDEVGDVTTVTYPGVYNEGAIYAATYGRGLYRCDAFLALDNSDVNIEENASTETLGVSIYPNPIVNDATISFSIDESSDVAYQIYDLSGRLVSNVNLGKYSQGSHNVNFNVANLNAGTYIIKVQAGEVSKTSKILVY